MPIDLVSQVNVLYAMEDETPIVAWPPCRAFYIESMLFRTKAALTSVANVNLLVVPILKSKDEIHNPEHIGMILDEIQNIFVQSAALSRFFWPPHDGEKKIHKKRGQFLRATFNIDRSSILSNRSLRNEIEHFEENLDNYMRQGIVGMIMPDYVGPYSESEIPYHIFRAYFTDIGEFAILGKRFKVNPVTEEAGRIHDLLIEFQQKGFPAIAAKS